MTAVQDCVSIFESEVKSLDAFMETSKLNPVFMATKKCIFLTRGWDISSQNKFLT